MSKFESKMVEFSLTSCRAHSHRARLWTTADLNHGGQLANRGIVAADAAGLFGSTFQY
jgi:hypothetical protein